MSKKMKIILMGIGALAFAIISTLPLFDLWFTVTVGIVFTLGYAIKNNLLPSNSSEGSLNIRDAVSGVLVAAWMALSTLLAAYATGIPISKHLFFVTITGAVLQYFTKTAGTGTKLN